MYFVESKYLLGDIRISQKDAYEIAEAVLTQSIYDLNIWMRENPNEVSLICGRSEDLSEEDFIRIFNNLSEINALNLLSLFVFRHMKYAEKNFPIESISIGNIVPIPKYKK